MQIYIHELKCAKTRWASSFAGADVRVVQALWPYIWAVGQDGRQKTDGTKDSLVTHHRDKISFSFMFEPKKTNDMELLLVTGTNTKYG